MGTSVMNYIILGVKLPCPEMTDDNESLYENCSDFFDNPYKSEIQENNGVSVIFDGMNGQYVFVGKIINKGNESTGGIEPTNCDFDRELKEVTAGYLNLAFGPKGFVSPLSSEEITVDDISVWVFSLWH